MLDEPADDPSDGTEAGFRPGGARVPHDHRVPHDGPDLDGEREAGRRRLPPRPRSGRPPRRMPLRRARRTALALATIAAWAVNPPAAAAPPPAPAGA